jgi:amino acid transporter
VLNSAFFWTLSPNHAYSKPAAPFLSLFTTYFTTTRHTKTPIIFIMRFATIFAAIALLFASFVSAMPNNGAYRRMEARALNTRETADL